jgi:tRNA(Ile)-lysidine synthase
VVKEHHLQGVLLAHHADDQAETVLQRLLRGSGAAGLAGMARATTLADLRVFRPLLGVRRQALRAFLSTIAQPWREDASNASPQYLRNRLRSTLADDPLLVELLLELAGACASLRDWTLNAAPDLPPEFQADDLANLPRVLANVSARRWLIARGIAPEKLEPASVIRLLAMSNDAASASKQQFPNGLTVRRRKATISAAR